MIVGYNTNWDTSEERYIQIYHLDSEQEQKIKTNDDWYALLVVDDLLFCGYPMIKMISII